MRGMRSRRVATRMACRRYTLTMKLSGSHKNPHSSCSSGNPAPHCNFIILNSSCGIRNAFVIVFHAQIVSNLFSDMVRSRIHGDVSVWTQRSGSLATVTDVVAVSIQERIKRQSHFEAGIHASLLFFLQLLQLNFPHILLIVAGYLMSFFRG